MIHREGVLSAETLSAESTRDLLRGNFDAIVWSSSWDRRAAVIGEANQDFTAGAGIFVDFEGPHDNAAKEESRRVVGAALSKSCQEVTHIAEPATDVFGVWEQIAARLGKLYVEKGRPLRIIMDMTSSPRFVFLALFARGFQQGIIGQLSFWYVDGKYTAPGRDQRVLFSSGEWRIVPVPGLQRTPMQDAPDHALVSVGFESERVMRVLSLIDPSRVVVLFPEPGVIKSYAEKTRTLNAELYLRYSVGNAHEARAHAADPVEGWRATRNLVDGLPEGLGNVVYVCGGTKPHSLAMALDCFQRDNSRLLYILPEEHRPANVSIGRYRWRYDLINHAAPLLGTTTS